MDFPSRSGGAQGGLIKSNLFAQSGMPAYSHTRHGDGVIHTAEGRISITREVEQAAPPYLLSHSYLGEKLDVHRIGLEPGIFEVSQMDGGRASVRRAGRGVFIGDGFFLSLRRNEDQTAARPMLFAVDDPVGTVVDFNVPELVEYMLPDGTGCLYPSLLATGWIDPVRRYGWAAIGILNDGPGYVFRSRYVCYWGDTGTREIHTVMLPTLPDSAIPVREEMITPIYQVSWWGLETIYYRDIFALAGGIGRMDGGPAQAFSVGSGHLLMLLVPQERLAVTDERSDRFNVAPNRLPPGSAPRLLRSRDHGATWFIEDASFLVADDPVKEDVVLKIPVQETSWPSMFVAAPMGEGRVAIAAHGRNLGNLDMGDAGLSVPPFLNYHAIKRAWRFYVSQSDGAGFINRPWPFDQFYGFHYRGGIFNEPSRRGLQCPIFSSGWRPGRTYSFGPGNFIFLSYFSQLVADNWGGYPQAYPVSAWVTRDYGNSWEPHVLPADCMPYAQSLQDLKDKFSIHSGGSRVEVSDAWALGPLALGMLEPASGATTLVAGSLPQVTFMTKELDGPMLLCAPDDPSNPIRSLIRQVTVGPDLFESNPGDFRYAFSSVAMEFFYTGDPRSPAHPELVYPGYPEFEAPA